MSQLLTREVWIIVRLAIDHLAFGAGLIGVVLDNQTPFWLSLDILRTAGVRCLRDLKLDAGKKRPIVFLLNREEENALNQSDVYLQFLPGKHPNLDEALQKRPILRSNIHRMVG